MDDSGQTYFDNEDEIPAEDAEHLIEAQSELERVQQDTHVQAALAKRQGWMLDRRGQLDAEIEAERRIERDARARRAQKESERDILANRYITEDDDPDRYDPERC